MITLASPSATRAGIDEAIDAALARMRDGMADVDGSADFLVAALSRATAGGKRFRPALVLASFDTLGGGTPSLAAFEVAAAFELLHAAFVVHDDVIDHDVERRGAPNVGGQFRRRAIERGADAAGAALLGDAAAILAGDLLLHEATRTVALADLTRETRADLLDLVDESVRVSAAGELSDVENAILPSDAIDPDSIIRATRNKTAVYSFSAPLEAGAVLAGAPTDSRLAFRRFGQRIGLAYQLVDDLIGAFGPADLAGRGEGGDLREAKRTPLIALARQSDRWPEVSDALAQAHTGPVAVRAAQRALTASGARERLEELIDETLQSAASAVDSSLLPDAARAMLHDLVEAVRERRP